MKQKEKRMIRRISAMLLAVCMMFGQLTGIPVRAQENETRLEVTTDLDWEDMETAEGEYVSVPAGVAESAGFYQDFNAFYPDCTFAVRYGEETVKAADLTLLDDGGTILSADHVKAVNENFVQLVFDAKGTYTLQYTPEGETAKACTLHVFMPHVGFYSSDTAGEENYITSFTADGTNVFYVGLSEEDGVTVDLKDTYENVPDDPWFVNSPVVLYTKSGERITEKEALELYLSWEAVEGKTGIWKFTPKKYAALEIADIEVQVQVADADATWWETKSIRISSALQSKKTLYATRSVYVDENNHAELYDAEDVFWEQDIWECIGDYELTMVLAKRTEGTETVCGSVSDFVVRDLQGKSCADAVVLTAQGTKDFMNVQYQKTGTYFLVYHEGQPDEAIMTIYLSFPDVGFYRTMEDITDQKAVGEVDCNEGDSFYVVLHNGNKLNTSKIHATDEEARENESAWVEYPFVVHADGKDITDAEALKSYITYTKVEHPAYEIYKITPNAWIQNMSLEISVYTEGEDDAGKPVYWTGCGYIHINSEIYQETTWAEPVWDDKGEIQVPSEAGAWHGADQNIWIGIDYTVSDIIIRNAKGQYVKASEISWLDAQGKKTDAISCCQNVSNADIVSIKPTKVGIYKLVYEDNGVKRAVDVQVDYPEIGFYTSAEKSQDTIIKDDCFAFGKKQRSFYVIFNEEYTVSNVQFDTASYTEEGRVVDTEPAVTWEPAGDAYLVTVKDSVCDDSKNVGVTYEIAYPWNSTPQPGARECALNMKQLHVEPDALSWEDAAFTYDGTEKEQLLTKACISQLPKGVVAVYKNNKGTNAGAYKAEVSFAYADGEVYQDYYDLVVAENLEFVHAFTIQKAVLDTSKIVWDYQGAFAYDGKEKSVTVKGMPKGLTAVYTGNQATMPGKYTAQVTFTYDEKNYQAPAKISLAPQNWEIVNKEPAPAEPTTAELTTAEPTTETPVVSVGDTGTQGSSNYRVISADTGNKEVQYTGTTKKSATKLTIPSSIRIDGENYQVTEIAANALRNNKKLKQVTIPKTVKTVGKNAFKGCKNLKKVTIKKPAVTKIADGAFQNCTKLTTITIPKTVKEIGKNAFRGCKNLKTVDIKSTKIKKMGKNAFSGLSKKTVVCVPKASKKAYTKLLRKAGYKGVIKAK